MDRFTLFLLVISAAALIQGKNIKSDFKPHVESCGEVESDPTTGGREKWCYAEIRPGVHKFFWLYYSFHADGWETRPLIMWLQGGPGASSTGYGNFEIMGPLDLDLQPREHTWVGTANVLYVDNPVGSGYSYVEDLDDLTTDSDEIAVDLLSLYTAFLEEIPQFRTIPLYVFGQSYGGKMGPVFAQHLHNAITDGFEAVLKGFAMGNAWTSPMDSTETWAPFLYSMSILDQQGVDRIDDAVELIRVAIAEGRWAEATNLWIQAEYVLWGQSNCVDFYNITNYVYPGSCPFTPPHGPPPKDETLRFQSKMNKFNVNKEDRPYVLDDKPSLLLEDLMNGVIKEKLGIIPESVVWGGQRGAVWDYQEGDFMKDVVGVVDDILKLEMYDVIVYQGQMDLICDTLGALRYVDRFTWDGMGDYYLAEKRALEAPISQITEVYVKAHGHLKFYWLNLAGHAVPQIGWSAFRMLERIIDEVDT